MCLEVYIVKNPTALAVGVSVSPYQLEEEKQAEQYMSIIKDNFDFSWHLKSNLSNDKLKRIVDIINEKWNNVIKDKFCFNIL